MTPARLFVLLLALALMLMAFMETTDPDLWWHLRTGELILSTGLPRTDPFSFTVPGRPWVTHEWLSQLLMWGLYQAGGLPALIIAFALLIAATFWLVYLTAPGRPYVAGLLTLVAAIASSILWGARPQMVNLFFLALFLWILERWRAAGHRGRWLWALPPLTLLWANLHSGYLLSVAVLAVYAVGSLISDWREPARRGERAGRLAATAVACLIAALLTPNGIALWSYPFATLGSGPMQRFLIEWQSPDFHNPYNWPFAGLLLMGFALLALSPRRPSATELLLFFGTAAAGLISMRHIPIFCVAAVPPMARALVALLEPHARLRPLLTPRLAGPVPLPMRLASILILLAAGALLLLRGASVIADNPARIADRYPVAAVDFIEQQGLDRKRLFNSYNWGGYLIWRQLPVFIDGRADVYGDAFMDQYFKTFGARASWRDVLAAHPVDYVLIERDGSLATLLEATNEWERIYQDRIAVIYVPKSPRP